MSENKLQHRLLDIIGKKPRIGVLTRDGLDAACFRLRLGDMLNMLAPVFDTCFYSNSAQLMPNGEFPYESEQAYVDAMDVFVVQRAFPSKGWKPLLQMIVDSGKPIIYEVDDWLIGMPESHPMYDMFHELFPVIEWLMPFCALITTTTETLAEKLRRYNANVAVVPNCVASARLVEPLVDLNDEHVLTIGFAGTETHKKDMEVLSAALYRIYQDYAGQVRFVFWGDVPQSLLGLKGVRRVSSFLPYQKYLGALAELRLDIALAPLKASEFNNGKSDLKWLEYSLVGAASVVSDVPPYAWLKGTGLAQLADNSEDGWFDAIAALIDNPDLRKRQARMAREHVLNNRLLEQIMPGVFSLWNSVLPPLLRKPMPEAWGEVAMKPLTGDDAAEARKYQLWWRNHNFREIHAEQLAERMMKEWSSRPKFNLLCLAPQTELVRLAASFQGMESQLYPYWRLIVLSDAPVPDPVFDSSDQLGWLQLDSLEDYETMVTAVNGIVADVPADWTLLLPAGFHLQPHALLRLGEAIDAHPEWLAIYTDHDVISPMRERFLPSFLPDFSPDYLRSMDYVGSAVAFSSAALAKIGGFQAFPNAYHYDVLLRLLALEGAQSIGHLDDVLISLPWSSRDIEPLGQAARLVALQNHAAGLVPAAEVSEGMAPGTFHFNYQVGGQPLVSVIVPTRDKLEYLEPCVDSLFEKTGYPHFELLIVDNRSEQPETEEYYQLLQQRFPGRVKVLRYDAPFNFSAQCNLAAQHAAGEFLLLLNNDTEIIFASWLERMLATAQQPGVGVVGARLIYPEIGKIQHAGIVLGLPGRMYAIADHVFEGQDLTENGYLNRSVTLQNYSAVTGACLLLSKEIYLQVGGMDEEDFKVCFNDVDLCLKVQAAGLRNVYNPFVTLYHHHAKSIGRATVDPIVALEAAVRERSELKAALRRWLPSAATDPGYNRHLSLSGRKMELETHKVVSWDIQVAGRKRVLGLPVPGGSGEYRLSQPLSVLQEQGKLDGEIHQPSHGLLSLVEMARHAPDTFLLHTGINDAVQDALGAYREFMPEIRVVFGIDDLIGGTPEKSNLYDHWKRLYPDAKQRLRKVLRLCDALVVSTEPLEQFTRDMIDQRIVIPNRLRKSIWGDLRAQRRTGRKPRVGWVGASQHRGDLELLFEVIKQTADEVDWVFMGMCLPQFRPYVAEVHHSVPFAEYPEVVAKLDLDLAVAPLEIHAFNEAKSNLRLLEYGAMAWPVVCTDIFPYQTNDAPVCRVPNEVGVWVEAIRSRVHDLDAAEREGDQLRAWVERHYWLEDHNDDWFRVLSG
ncbi:glycosyltransferase [Chromobacterium haemolyticum]|uniref:glycosyltransferase n=1 Tax=Chromobacterium TaxID=535 RepID=UPI0040566B7A